MKGVLNIQGDAEHIPLKDDAVALTFTSPPYLCARTYSIGAQRECSDWIEWMLRVVTECCRVTSGIVLVNCAGVTRDWCYRPGPEGLLYEWWKRGGRCWRPSYWQRVGIPGSGGKQWLRADVEYVLCFTKCKAAIPWADNVANGHPPKWAPGGEMSHRLGGRVRTQWGGSEKSGGHSSKNGDKVAYVRPSHVLTSNADLRVNALRKSMYRRGQNGERQNPAGTILHTKSLPDGTDEIQCYTPPVRANPGNVVRVKVGGGLLGHPLAHENEAPFPVDLAAWFIRSHCPPNGIVLDCFGGSGTTADAALREGRRAITADLRFKMCQLTARRLATPYAKKAKRPRAAKPEPSLFPEVGVA